MRRVPIVFATLVVLATGAIAAAPAPAAADRGATASSVSPLVGRWQRTTTCQELTAALTKAGLRGLTPYAWREQTSSNGQGSFQPGSPPPSITQPCRGAIPRAHSHFFDGRGQFGSLDWLGGQVDDGPYRLVDDRTVRIGGVSFRFRILSGRSLMLTPVLTSAMAREARVHPARFSAAGWAVSVAYAGHTWKRVACGRWC